jgi:hypothetical protein
MVASGSRTMIAGSSSSCIAGFHRSCRSSRSSGPRRSCVGIGPAFAAAALGLIALFVIGAAAGSLIVLGRGANRQPWVLLAEAGLVCTENLIRVDEAMESPKLAE